MKKIILNKVVETIEVEITTPQFRKKTTATTMYQITTLSN